MYRFVIDSERVAASREQAFACGMREDKAYARRRLEQFVARYPAVKPYSVYGSAEVQAEYNRLLAETVMYWEHQAPRALDEARRRILQVFGQPPAWIERVMPDRGRSDV